MSKRDNCILVSNRSGARMAERIAQKMGIPMTEMVVKEFADGELYHAFPCPIAGRDLIIVATTETCAAHQELLDLVAGARFWNALSVNVVIPYLGYSTMERAKPDSGEIPKGITRTRQLFRARPNYVAFVDLHAEAVLHAHTGEVRTRHIWSEQLAADKIRSLNLERCVLVSPDYGFSKRAARLAGLLGCQHTAANKDRFGIDQTIVGQLSGAVRGCTAVICDDMIRTGGSMLQTIDRCLEAGAVGVMVMATHLVLSGDACARFRDKGVTRIIGADTYPGRESDGFLEVYSVAPLIAP